MEAAMQTMHAFADEPLGEAGAPLCEESTDSTSGSRSGCKPRAQSRAWVGSSLQICASTPCGKDCGTELEEASLASPCLLRTLRCESSDRSQSLALRVDEGLTDGKGRIRTFPISLLINHFSPRAGHSTFISYSWSISTNLPSRPTRRV